MMEGVDAGKSMRTDMRSTRPGRETSGVAGVHTRSEINGEELFYSHAGLRGGRAR